MNARKRTRVSKACSLFLRHRLDEFESKSSDGFVDMAELVAKISSSRSHSHDGVTEEDIVEMSMACAKRRTQIDGSRIRCVQGHSSKCVDVEELMEEITTPLTQCYHATNTDAADAIQISGLKRMTRQHIHFYRAEDTHLMRKHQQVRIEVNMAEAMAAGKYVFRSYRGFSSLLLVSCFMHVEWCIRQILSSYIITPLNITSISYNHHFNEDTSFLYHISCKYPKS